MHSSAPAGGTRCARRSSRASSAASAPSSPTAGEFPFPAECPECNATGETKTELDLLPRFGFMQLLSHFPARRDATTMPTARWRIPVIFGPSRTGIGGRRMKPLRTLPPPRPLTNNTARCDVKHTDCRPNASASQTKIIPGGYPLGASCSASKNTLVEMG